VSGAREVSESSGSSDQKQAAGPEGARRRAPRAFIVVPLVALIIGAAWFAWTRTHRDVQRMCTLAGAVDTPGADSPDAAFEAWWQADGLAASMQWASYGGLPEHLQPPTRGDFVRLDPTDWEWRFTHGHSVGVHVAHGPDVLNRSSGWAVDGVNACTYRTR
jgi:hypothetical protein